MALPNTLEMELILMIVIAILLMAFLVLTTILLLRKKTEGSSLAERISGVETAMAQLDTTLSLLQASLARLESGSREEFRISREENASIARENRLEQGKILGDIRKELLESLDRLTTQNQQALQGINKTLSDRVEALTDRMADINKSNREEQALNLKAFAAEQTKKSDELKIEQKELTQKTVEQLEKITAKVEEKLKTLAEQSVNDNNLMREAMALAIKGFGETLEKSISAFNELQKEKFGQLDVRQNELVKNTETKLESIRITVEEKLEKTLSERLGQSFETVGKQLIEVQKGLGEMQTIATDVGGLKKVLSNVKLRGGVGEVQLAMLLEQILAPGQYDANVRTKAGSADPVEFAIKLPGRSEDENDFVYLPIDAKFPKDTYEHLIEAYENAIPGDIEEATVALENTIKKMARDIRDKYLDPPNTTDFAILFLPFESIYAEVIRRSPLVDQLRDEFRITVAGPTTLMALLNSLQMGFRTLALQKRSSEVWRVLSSVKTEFEKFGGMLTKAQNNIQTGLGQLDNVVGVRTRAIQRHLRKVEALPAAEARKILPDLADLPDEGVDDEEES
ncbi:MAG: DNA recombination protein RmuC [Prolixibacteraceae bacterium]|nr:DNA recombination protein RmuC [Prolixibacteraceae bacterium]HOG95676.1 DNA recombination protein RmuC [Prolixibacteraceae bacterium]HOY92187.1 DNA recombination protein RmuC [Prolixibacteraceae bacterium]HPI34011.1 DNA recombination protein RmuC [Prolixibacteraceae bacterium]HPN75539.1 DNA recombination protein RmuC [Prolixibacteraceae bacterium]